MTDIKQKLLDECLSAGIDERASFFETLIDIILQQRAALETVERAYPTSGERMGHQDFAKRAVAATDAALKKIGVE